MPPVSGFWSGASSIRSLENKPGKAIKIVTLSLAYIALYALLVGVASFIEVPVGRGLGAFQLNTLIRLGSLAAAVTAVVIVDGFTLPAGPSVLLGLGIGLISGIGSILYCLALVDLPVALVVTLANLYLVVTIVLGIVVLGEPITPFKVLGLIGTVVGVVLLGYAPARYGVHDESIEATQRRRHRAPTLMAVYILIVGASAFLEKPALRGLDPTQLNGLMAITMTAVAAIALAARRRPLPTGWRGTRAVGVGVVIGLASIFYFLALRGLPVSVAAACSNAYMVVTVVLSIVVLGQPLTRVRGAAIGLTILGCTLLALSAG